MYESLQQLDALNINFNRTGNWLLVLFMAVVMYGVALGLKIHVLGVLDVGYYLHLKLGKMGQALGVLADAVNEPFLVCFAYDDKENLHINCS